VAVKGHVEELLQLYVSVSYVVGVDGAEALQGRGCERDAGRTTDVLHPLHMTDTPLEDTANESQLIHLVYLERTIVLHLLLKIGIYMSIT